MSRLDHFLFPLVVVLGFAGTAAAESPSTEVVAEDARARTREKSPTAATAWSVVPTVVGAGLLATAIIVLTSGNSAEHVFDPKTNAYTSTYPAWKTPVGVTAGIVGGVAFLVGPSLGHAYSGRTWNGGLKVRLAAVGIAALGTLIASGTCERGYCANQLLGGGIVLAGAGTLIVGTLMELATAGTAARDFNARLSVAPIATGTGTTAGMFVDARF